MALVPVILNASSPCHFERSEKSAASRRRFLGRRLSLRASPAAFEVTKVDSSCSSMLFSEAFTYYGMQSSLRRRFQEVVSYPKSMTDKSKMSPTNR